MSNQLIELRKADTVWRTRSVTECDVYEAGNKIGHLEFEGKIEIARLAKLVRQHYETPLVSPANVSHTTKLYAMPLTMFYALAEAYNTDEVIKKQ